MFTTKAKGNHIIQPSASANVAIGKRSGSQLIFCFQQKLEMVIKRTMYRNLNPEKIVGTIERLHRRIEERFPASSLSHVCLELKNIALESTARAERFASPNWWLRGGVALVVLLGVIGIAAGLFYVEVPLSRVTVPELIQVVESGLNEIILIGAAMIFLVTAETRIKRARALDALHELRSISHVIDMHQLTKDPAHLSSKVIFTASSPRRQLTPFELIRYLDYCSELLSLTGKVAAVYAQNFRDHVVLATVNDLETLTTGLSRKIWQKIIILEQPEPSPSPFLSGSTTDRHSVG